MLLTQLLIAMTRDRERDRAAGVVTTAAKLSRPAAITTIIAALTALTLLAGLGAAWWTAAPAVLLGWTSTPSSRSSASAGTIGPWVPPPSASASPPSSPPPRPSRASSLHP